MSWLRRIKNKQNIQSQMPPFDPETLEQMNQNFSAERVVRNSGVLNLLGNSAGIGTKKTLQWSKKLCNEINNHWHDISHHYFDLIRGMLLNRPGNIKAEKGNANWELNYIKKCFMAAGLKEEEAYHKTLEGFEMVKQSVHRYYQSQGIDLTELGPSSQQLLR